MSGVPLERAIELLHQAKAESGTSKFNCTELDSIDSGGPGDECLSCECENDCSQPAVDPIANEKVGLCHLEFVQADRPAYRSETSYNGSCNLINNSNIFSTPVHRPNRNRMYEQHNKYENLISRESVIAVTAAVPSGRMHGDVQLSPGLIEIIPESDRMDRRQINKQQHLNLQLHHATSDLRPSPGFTSDAEILSHMPGMNYNRSGLLRSSSSTNSSSLSSSDAVPIRSLPASPAQRRRAFGRSILSSPLMLRKVLKQK
jgi:hypothetical protein